MNKYLKKIMKGELEKLEVLIKSNKLSNWMEPDLSALKDFYEVVLEDDLSRVKNFLEENFLFHTLEDGSPILYKNILSEFNEKDLNFAASINDINIDAFKALLQGIAIYKLYRDLYRDTDYNSLK